MRCKRKQVAILLTFIVCRCHRQQQREQLNDDVLALILRHLNVYQQFEMTQLHSRLENVIQTLWRTRIRHVLLHQDMFELTRPTARRFVRFMQALLPHVEYLQWQHLNVRWLRWLSAECFHTVHTLEWRGVGFVDEDVQLLQRLFPNLRTLKLSLCQISGKYLSALPQLGELCLNDCQYLDSEHLRGIFSQLRLRKFDIMEDCDEVNCCDLVQALQCHTLEHLKIADYHLCMDPEITNDLVCLPALHKLSIYSKNFVFDVLDRVARHCHGRGKIIDGFCFSGVLHNFARFFAELGQLRQLRHLAVYGCSNLAAGDMECINDHMLLQLSQQLPELCELHFSDCQLESYRGLLHFVTHCRQLRLLDITRSRRIGNAFVWHCQQLLGKQRWRTQPLELWIRLSDIDNDIVENPRYIRNDKLLRIDAKRLSSSRQRLSGILKFTFKPA